MSSYAMLLETYDESHKYDNSTFSEVSTCLESLTAFVNEDVNFEVTISLNEAENGLKDKAATIKAAVKNGAAKLAQKLEEFVKKIGEALAQFKAKAKEIVANKGNKALAKLVTKGDAKLTKDIKLETILNGSKDVEKVFSTVLNATKDLDDQAKAASDFVAKGGATAFTLVPESAKSAVEVLASKPDHKMETLQAATGYGIKKLYEGYVAPYLKAIDENIADIEKNCKSAMKLAKDVSAKLKSADTLSSTDLSTVSAFTSVVMRLHTGILNFAFDVLSVCAKNSAKLALASGQASPAAQKVAKGEEKVKAAGTKVADAAKGAKDAVAAKLPKKGENKAEA